MTVEEIYDSLSPTQRDLLSFLVSMAIKEYKNEYRKLDLCPECMKKISNFYIKEKRHDRKNEHITPNSDDTM
jgi:hypothetical protein